MSEKSMEYFGFVRVSAISPLCKVGNPRYNLAQIELALDKHRDSDVVVFPELSITGYTCGDLFRQQLLLEQAENAVWQLTRNARSQLVFVGAPVPVGSQLYNCAIAIFEGKIIGIIPKQNIPTYNEFYESRWFRGADGTHEPEKITYGSGHNVPFGTDLIFDLFNGRKVFAEICEDVWMPIPPSSYAAIAGANILVNLSASNETVAKSTYRRDLVANQSGRCAAAYIYASSGPTESTTDVVFGGHCLIAENSHILAESDRVGDGKGLIRETKSITADIDCEKLNTERRLLSSFGEARRLITPTFRVIDNFCASLPYKMSLHRYISGTPFVPKDKATLHARCAEITGIQVHALAKRIEGIPSKKSYIGVSGGLDSTLALLVGVETYQSLGLDTKFITGITMPGFGTTSKTKQNALDLMDSLLISRKTIDIRVSCYETWRAMGHNPFGIEIKTMPLDKFEEALQNLTPEQLENGDLVFENVQARERTKILMSHGFVLGTGDLSELALGWCTYNGDHMSMYNVNCSIPKTLVKFLVDYYADNRIKDTTNEFVVGVVDNSGILKKVLKDIVATTISPELLPHTGDQITQSTEDNIGPYELHDFFLVNFVRNGFTPKKILFLSEYADFSKTYTREERVKTLRTFIKRFFTQQFKRSCVPDGPKVGSVSLSPRGDWRMPSDACVEMWLEELKGEK